MDLDENYQILIIWFDKKSSICRFRCILYVNKQNPAYFHFITECVMRKKLWWNFEKESSIYFILSRTVPVKNPKGTDLFRNIKFLAGCWILTITFAICLLSFHAMHYTLSVKRNLSLLQSDIHWNPLHQNDFIFVHKLGKFILNELSTSKKTKVYFNQSGDECDEIARGQFSKITEIACLSGLEFEADNSPYGIYVTRHWNWMNSYWMLWIGRLHGARSELTRWAVSAIF